MASTETRFSPMEGVQRVHAYLKGMGLHLPLEPEDVQQDWSLPFMRWVIQNTSSGMEFRLPDTDPPGIRIGTHRDIVCDPALYNLARVEAGRPTTHIVLGSNLAGTEWIRNLMVANHAIFIDRSLTGRAALHQQLELSAQIKEIVESGGHVWIAQGPGRSKDGKDETSPSLLRMLGLAWGGENDGPAVLQGLLRPVVIRYDINPCDMLLVREKLTGEKEEREDERSMRLGLEGWKGRVQCHESEAIDISSKEDPWDWVTLAKTVDQAIRDAGIHGQWAHDALRILKAPERSSLPESLAERLQSVKEALGPLSESKSEQELITALCEVYREGVGAADEAG